MFRYHKSSSAAGADVHVGNHSLDIHENLGTSLEVFPPTLINIYAQRYMCGKKFVSQHHGPGFSPTAWHLLWPRPDQLLLSGFGRQKPIETCHSLHYNISLS